MGPGLSGGGTELELGRGFGLQAEDFSVEPMARRTAAWRPPPRQSARSFPLNDPASVGGPTGPEAAIPMGLPSLDVRNQTDEHFRTIR